MRTPIVGIRVAAALLVVLPTVVACSFGPVGLPGEPNYRATITVLNRTTAPVTVSSGEGGPVSFDVPACGEVTRADFPVNWWDVTSPGRDTFHSGGGASAQQTYAIVTSFVEQRDQRPAPLPVCEGLLQPAQH